MSALGDLNFVQNIREKLAEQIDREKTLLVLATSERAAGHVQGLMDALELMNLVYRDMTGDDRKQ